MQAVAGASLVKVGWKREGVAQDISSSGLRHS